MFKKKVCSEKVAQFFKSTFFKKKKKMLLSKCNFFVNINWQRLILCVCVCFFFIYLLLDHDIYRIVKMTTRMIDLCYVFVIKSKYFMFKKTTTKKLIERRRRNGECIFFFKFGSWWLIGWRGAAGLISLDYLAGINKAVSN